MKLAKDVNPTYRIKEGKNGTLMFGGVIKELLNQNLMMKSLIAICGVFAAVFAVIAGVIVALGKAFDFLKKQANTDSKIFKIFFVVLAVLNRFAAALKEKSEE